MKELVLSKRVDPKVTVEEIKKQLIEAYDKDASLRLKRNGNTRKGWKKDEIDIFVNTLHSEGKKTVLELGAGTGIDSKRFFDEGFEVLSTDISPGMVEACKTLGIEAKVLDLYELDQLDMTFDAVFSMNVLLHIPQQDLDPILKMISERLNKNGLFYLGVYGGMDKEEIMNDKRKMGLDRYFSYLSGETLLKHVSKCFEVVDFHEIESVSFEPWFLYQSVLLRKC